MKLLEVFKKMFKKPEAVSVAPEPDKPGMLDRIGEAEASQDKTPQVSWEYIQKEQAQNYDFIVVVDAPTGICDFIMKDFDFIRSGSKISEVNDETIGDMVDGFCIGLHQLTEDMLTNKGKVGSIPLPARMHVGVYVRNPVKAYVN